MKLKQGFTLAELMIAMGILFIVISGLLVAFVSCILLNESNNNLVIAANDAQYVLEQVKKVNAYDDIDDFIASFDPSYFVNLNNETITFPNPPDTDIGSIAEVTVNVRWSMRGGSKDFSLSTRIAR